MNEEEDSQYSLHTELETLLNEITTLTESPEFFLMESTHTERRGIYNYLEDILLNADSLYNVHESLNQLKIALRPFRTLQTKHVLADYNNKLTELTQQIERLETLLDSAKKAREQSQSLLNMIEEEHDRIKLDTSNILSKNKDLVKNIAKSEQQAQRINDLKIEVESKKETFDSFIKTIDDRTTQLNNQETATNEYQEKLLEFTEERKKLLQEADSLVKDAKNALELTTAHGIGKFFQARLHKLEPEGGNWIMRVLKSVLNPRFGWILGAAFFSIAAIGISVDFIKSVQEQGGELTFILLLARLSIVILPIAGAWFCAGQYTKLKNIAEDYAYKTVLAQSIMGFSEHFKKDDQNGKNYQSYLLRVLAEIHQHPLANHKKSVKKEKTTPINKL